MISIRQVVWILAIILSAAAHSSLAHQIDGQVVAVIDGDTLTVLDTLKQQHRVRLAEIDAPEKAQPFGRASKRALSEICFRRHARVTVFNVDRYGRIIGRVYCDGVDANLLQVQRGYAWVYDRYAKDPLLKQAQAQARAANLGLWAEPNPVPPWEWRRR